MYITVTLEIGGKSFDLNVDDRGSISAAYAILKERGMVGGKASPALFKSMLLNKWIDAKKPLSNQGVVSGDILTAPV